MPWHEKRTWVVHPIESAEALAEKLIGHSWCSCAGWSLGGYLFLNDQTSEDGAFEVAVVKPPAEPGGEWWQIESVTFGWMLESPRGGWEHQADYGRDAAAARERACELIERYISGVMDPGTEGGVAWKCEPCDVESPEQHGRCHLCA
jgi:hypothetical protein